jgi:hypothetical protein
VLARADRRGGRYAAYALLAALRARPELSQLAPAFAARIGPAAVDTYLSSRRRRGQSSRSSSD